ncbi:hypothetical protein GW17_00057525 [Ensete ventricosum]|nr:hypothetical protein GW17_00057525 [Ensete ventricosum]
MAAIPRASLGLVAIMLLALDIVLPSVHAQAPAPAPTSDGDLIFNLPFWDGGLTYCFFVGAGASIDQGIAYLLLLVALVLTYLVHPLDDASTPLKALINRR